MNHLVDGELRRLAKRKDALMDQVEALELDFQAKIRKIEEASEKIDEMYDRVNVALETFKYRIERSASADLKRAQRRIKELEKQLESGGGKIDKVDYDAVAKGRTLAVFDSILFNICNWSTAGDTAPDFELASQAILFPAVYERVMDGDREDYILDKVPASALEVIKRGREWIRYFRQSCELSLADPNTWAENIETVARWWLNDALPLIYGSRDPDWEHDEPFSQQEMIAWRDFPANRALSFPLIFDGMETVNRYSSKIRESSGIPQLDISATKTRLEPV